jgi:hypothetical protein
VRRFFARFCLAAALALAAPGAYAHALTHIGDTFEGQRHHDDAGDEHQASYGCALDAAFAGADALGSCTVAPILPVVVVPAPEFLQASRFLPCEALERFASRAPPLPA